MMCVISSVYPWHDGQRGTQNSSGEEGTTAAIEPRTGRGNDGRGAEAEGDEVDEEVSEAAPSGWL